jgi:hypothetical protein
MSSFKKGGPSRDGREHRQQDQNQANQKRPRTDNQGVVQNNSGSRGERNASNDLDQLMRKRATLKDENYARRFFHVALECGNSNPVNLIFRFTNTSQEGKYFIKGTFSLVFGNDNVDLNKTAVFRFLGEKSLIRAP